MTNCLGTSSRSYVLFNLSIDDVHPESSKYLSDCGGDKERGNFRFLLDLLNEFADMKVTLFVTPNWVDKPNDAGVMRLAKKVLKLDYSNMWEDEPFKLSKHEEWCNWLSNYVNLGAFELGVHGFNHHNADGTAVNHSMEFVGLSYAECLRRLRLSEEILRDADLRFSKVFRPPGWGTTYELLKALRETGYALSCKSIGLTPEVVQDVVNIPPNWNIGADSIERGVEIACRYGIVTAYGHITDSYGREYLSDGLNEVNVLRTKALLRVLTERFNLVFVTLTDILNLVLRGGHQLE